MAALRRLGGLGGAGARLLSEGPKAGASLPAFMRPISEPVGPPVSFSVDANALDVTSASTIQSGVQVVSEDRFGLTSTVGVFLPGGSRFETSETAGSTGLSDLLMLRGTRSMSANQLSEAFNAIGAQVACISAREHLAIHATVLRHHVPRAMELIADIVRRPYYDEGDFNEQVINAEYMFLQHRQAHMNYVGDLAHECAYPNQSLAHAVIAAPEVVSQLTLERFWKYRQSLLRPKHMLVAGLGVAHEDLRKLAEEHFGSGWTDEQLTSPPPATHPAKYVGGNILVDNKEEQNLHVALLYEGFPYHGPHMFAQFVANWMLGGGSTFSSGGPGKGIYSRLYGLLYQYHVYETVQCYSAMYGDSSLFGVYMAIRPSARGDRTSATSRAIRIVARELEAMAHSIPEDELQRAKNQLKSSLLMNLETSAISFDDLGRQVQAYGRKYGTAELCARIDEVTATDVSTFLSKIMSTTPTIVGYGDLRYMPTA